MQSLFSKILYSENTPSARLRGGVSRVSSYSDLYYALLIVTLYVMIYYNRPCYTEFALYCYGWVLCIILMNGYPQCYEKMRKYCYYPKKNHHFVLPVFHLRCQSVQLTIQRCQIVSCSRQTVANRRNTCSSVECRKCAACRPELTMQVNTVKRLHTVPKVTATARNGHTCRQKVAWQ